MKKNKKNIIVASILFLLGIISTVLLCKAFMISGDYSRRPFPGFGDPISPLTGIPIMFFFYSHRYFNGRIAKLSRKDLVFLILVGFFILMIAIGSAL